MERPVRILLVVLALAALPSAAAQGGPGVLFVRQVPALEVTALQDSVDLLPGERGALTYRIENVGNDTAAFTLRANELVPFGANRTLGFLVEPEVARLWPGESLVATVHLYAFKEEAYEARVALEVFTVGGLALGGNDTAVTVRAMQQEPVPPGGGVPPPVALAAVATVVGLGGAFALFRRDAWRHLVALALAPLYTRLAPSRLLDQEKRESLHRLIGAHPGIHYSDLKRRTGLPAGVLVHHLRTLERHGLIVSRRDGAFRRFAPAAAPFPAPAPAPITPMQRRVLDLLAGAPRTQRQIAEALGLSQQGANRHVKTLERRGLLAIRFEEGEWRCHAVAQRE